MVSYSRPLCRAASLLPASRQCFVDNTCRFVDPRRPLEPKNILDPLCWRTQQKWEEGVARGQRPISVRVLWTSGSLYSGRRLKQIFGHEISEIQSTPIWYSMLTFLHKSHRLFPLLIPATLNTLNNILLEWLKSVRLVDFNGKTNHTCTCRW